MNTWEAVLAVECARQHYGDGRSLTEIADEVGLSRFKVGRLVQAARDAGWVQVRVDSPPGVDLGLTRELATYAAEHGVRRVLVTPDAGGIDALRRAAADAVEDSTVEGDVLGLACGRTVNSVIATIRRLPRCEVVQLTGLTAPGDVRDSSVETIRRAARLTGSGALPVYEPMVQPSRELADERRDHPSLARAFARWQALTAALINVGSWEPGQSNVYDSPVLDDAARRRADRAGVVAEFCGHLVDTDGQVVATEITGRCLVVPLDRLRQAREVTAVAAVPQRARGVAAALRAGTITTLVAVEGTASALLGR